MGLRKLVIDLVLSTDMKKHIALVAALKSKVDLHRHAHHRPSGKNPHSSDSSVTGAPRQ